jgi:FkbM family methyltransferase
VGVLLARLSAKAAEILILRKGAFRSKHRLAKLLGFAARGIPIRSKYGVLLEAHLDDLTNYLALVGYETDTVAVAVASLEKGDAFIDIGANTGVFSLVAAKRVGADGVVISFEPQPKMAEVFRANMRLNGVLNAHLFEFALGERTGNAKLSVHPGHSGAAGLREEGDLPVLLVNPLYILPLLQALIGSRRTLIKVDVEGAEEIVVRALAPVFDSLNISKCVVEIDPSNLQKCGSSEEGLYRQMGKHGFKPHSGSNAGTHYDEVFERDLPAGNA